MPGHPDAGPDGRPGCRLDLSGPGGRVKLCGGGAGQGSTREVVGECVGDAGVPGGFAVPAAGLRVGVEVLDVGELAAERRCEFGSGDEVVAGLADVGIRAGAGGLVAGAVAVRDAGLEHLTVQPADLVRDDRLSGRGEGELARERRPLPSDPPESSGPTAS
jgi:hypothetical protein